MYSTCIFCHHDLGTNDEIEAWPIGRRLAFDSARGRLWVVCTDCGRWNLTPLEERWEPIERCEALYRNTWQRYSIENIGFARTRSRLELVRIGDALPPEIAAWRYGARLERGSSERSADGRGLLGRGRRFVARHVAAALARTAEVAGLSEATTLRLSMLRRGRATLTHAIDDAGSRIVIRYEHLAHAELIRPANGLPWRISVLHDGGRSLLAHGPGLLTAGKLLAVLNFAAVSDAEIQWAVGKLGDASDPNGFFSRIASLALKTDWGLRPEAASSDRRVSIVATSTAERLALGLANRSFWGFGGTGSQPAMPLYRLPSVNRLALEMAANEDAERRALEGELEDLRDAWREAEEIAEIADNLFVGETLEEFKRQFYQKARP